jgi:predicted dehydrogenase
VYVEKPFTVNVREADEIIAAAETRSLSVCLGHDQLFDPAWLECRRLHETGELGRVVHVESIQGYDLDGPFGRALVANPTHWVHSLPGGLFQNVISHALARITDFMPDEDPVVQAFWFSGEAASGFPTELRVFLRGREMTGDLIFTSAARPVQKVARVFGTRMTLHVDLDGRTVRRQRPPTWPSVLAKVQLPWWEMKESALNFATNVGRLWQSDLHYFAGMHTVFQQFYRAIQIDEAPPVTHAEARRVTALMDHIFERCSGAESVRVDSPAQLALS